MGVQESLYSMYQQLLEHRRIHIASFKLLEDNQNVRSNFIKKLLFKYNM